LTIDNREVFLLASVVFLTYIEMVLTRPFGSRSSWWLMAMWLMQRV